MAIWFTSDHHFGHANIIKYCNRPFRSVAEMDRVMIERWNESVRDFDTVVVLGDFSFHKRERTVEIAQKLKGSKYICFGNHDKQQVQHALIIDCGWIELDQSVWKYMGYGDLMYSHYPYRHGAQDKRPMKYPEFDGRNPKTLIHGHVHEAYKLLPYQINVSVDVWDFRPVRFKEIRK